MRPVITIATLVVALAAGACRAPVQIEELPEEHTASGLTIRDLRVGEGAEVTRGSRVTVHYVGRYSDGTRFDSSYDRGVPLQFTVGVGDVVPGWEQGMLGMRVGGQRRILIPPQLGFVDGTDEAFQQLDLEVELLELE